MPKRIQRKRTKGWRAPAGAINCTRPGPLGNPFSVEKYGRETCIQMFRDWLDGRRRPTQEAPAQLRAAIIARIPDLRGHDLMCWCPLDEACHVDVYLDRANS